MLNNQLHECTVVKYRHPWYLVRLVNGNEELQVKVEQIQGNIPAKISEGLSVVKRSDRDKYVITKKKGTKYRSLDKGDETAKALRPMTLDEVYDLTAKLCRLKTKDLKSRYSDLPIGIQRMTLGNMIRATKHFDN